MRSMMGSTETAKQRYSKDLYTHLIVDNGRDVANVEEKSRIVRPAEKYYVESSTDTSSSNVENY